MSTEQWQKSTETDAAMPGSRWWDVKNSHGVTIVSCEFEADADEIVTLRSQALIAIELYKRLLNPGLGTPSDDINWFLRVFHPDLRQRIQ